MTPVITRCDNRLAWLKARQTGVGGSDAPNLIGLGYGSAESVYRSKTEPVTDRPAGGFLRLGTALEPLVGEMYAEAMGVEVWPCGLALYRHPARPWQFATPDFKRPDGLYVQAKTLAGWTDEWGPTGTDQIPPDYRVQVAQEMAVTGTDAIDLAALCRISGELRVYRVLWDADLWGWLTDIEAEFWEYVERRKPLPADWYARFEPAVAKLVEPDPVPDLGEEVARLIDRHKEYAGIGKEAEEEARRIKGQIEALIGTNRQATAGGWTVKWVEVAGGEVPATTRKASRYLKFTPKKEKVRK